MHHILDAKMDEGDAVFASNIRTNLHKLTSEELASLDRHAQSLLGHRIATYATELLATA